MCTLPQVLSRRRAHSLAIRRAPRRSRDGLAPNVHIGAGLVAQSLGPRDSSGPNVHIGLEAVAGPRGVQRRIRRRCAHCWGISRAAFLISATELPPMCTLGPKLSRARPAPATEVLPMCTLPVSLSRACRTPRRNRGECASRGEKTAGSVRFSRRIETQCAHCRRSCRAGVHTPLRFVAVPVPCATARAPMCTWVRVPSLGPRGLATSGPPMCTLLTFPSRPGALHFRAHRALCRGGRPSCQRRLGGGKCGACVVDPSESSQGPPGRSVRAGPPDLQRVSVRYVWCQPAVRQRYASGTRRESSAC